MKLTLTRDNFTTSSTQGILQVDGVEYCFTLELPVVDGKPGSAVPNGIYPVTITYSPKFQRDMPLLLDIPGRSEIRIHWGNYEGDTDGCILVGTTRTVDFVGTSRDMFDSLYTVIEGPARAGELTIEITGALRETIG